MPTRAPGPAPFSINHEASRSLRSASSDRDSTAPRNSAAGCDGIVEKDASSNSGKLRADALLVSSHARFLSRYRTRSGGLEIGSSASIWQSSFHLIASQLESVFLLSRKKVTTSLPLRA